MNYSAIKNKMDKFFKESSLDDLMRNMEEVGYRFIDNKISYITPELDYEYHVHKACEHSNRFKMLIEYLTNKKKNNESLANYEAFLFNLHYGKRTKSYFSTRQLQNC